MWAVTLDVIDIKGIAFVLSPFSLRCDNGK